MNTASVYLARVVSALLLSRGLRSHPSCTGARLLRCNFNRKSTRATSSTVETPTVQRGAVAICGKTSSVIRLRTSRRQHQCHRP